MATGSCLSFRKFRPFRGVPAGTELRIRGVAFFSTAPAAAAAASFFRDGGAPGVNFSLKGCAAEVEVAAGGVRVEPGVPWLGVDSVEVEAEMGVALWRGVVVVKKREARGVGTEEMEGRVAARRQRRQIIVRCWAALMGWVCYLGGVERVATWIESLDGAEYSFSGLDTSIDVLQAAALLTTLKSHLRLSSNFS
jgi:hypothetical protein